MGGDKLKETQVVDEYTVKLIYNEPYAAILTYLSDGATGIDSPAAIEEFGEDYGVTALVGTGPFRLWNGSSDDHVTLERNLTTTGRRRCSSTTARPISTR